MNNLEINEKEGTFAQYGGRYVPEILAKELDKIAERWKNYDATGELDWWLKKSPNFYWSDSND